MPLVEAQPVLFSTHGTNVLDVAMIQYGYNIYVEASIISHSVEVTGFPGLLQPPTITTPCHLNPTIHPAQT